MAQRPHRWRVTVLGAALLVSLAFHVGMFLWMGRGGSAAPRPVAAEPISLEVVELPPPPPAATAPAQVKRTPPPHRAQRPARAPLASDAPTHSPPPVVASDVPKVDAPKNDAPVNDAPASDAPRAMALVPSSSFALPSMPDAGTPPATASLTPPPTLSADALVRNLAHDTIARGRVERGLVHPYFREVGKALMKAWDAERAVSQKGLQGYGQKLKEDTRTWGRIWMTQAERFGAGGSPLGDSPLIASRAMDDSAAARDALKRQARATFKESRRAVIRVVQDRTGKVLSVELLEPSRNVEVDKAAVADVRAAAERMPPPPPEAIGDHPTLTSTWEFELVVSISPPVPTMTFEFDETRGFVDPRLPLDRRIYKTVRLVAAE